MRVNPDIARSILGAFACGLVVACGASAPPPPGDASQESGPAAQQVAVTVTPPIANAVPAVSIPFTAAVTGTGNRSVIWTIMAPGAPTAGTIDSDGTYHAPATVGTYNVVATSVADATKSAIATVNVAAATSTDTTGLLPAGWRTLWNPGLNAVGGIPSRSTIYTTLNPSGADDTAAIQTALNNCPANQVVKLGPGTFNISGNGLSITRSNVTLRGSGMSTRLVKAPGSSYPVVIIGTRWYKRTQPVNLAADGVKGSNVVTLASNPGLQVGETVTIDQLTDATLTQWSSRSPPGDASRGWFGRYDRPVGQVLEVKSVSGATVTFTTPLHMDFLTASAAQLVRFSAYTDGPVKEMVRYSGIEDLYVYGGEGGDGGGNIHLFATAYSWVKNVESDGSRGSSVNLDGTFRSEVRDSYVHSALDPNPGGSGYGISVNAYAADNLIENNAVWNFNKVIVFRTSGGGNVVGYNYMDDAYGAGYTWMPEVGLNASHMTTPHMELFEGNQSFNFDSDVVWGNSIYITVFRNHLTGLRRSIAPLALTDTGPRRMAGTQPGCWWFSFVGNVLGFAGMPTAPQSKWVYDKNGADAGNNAVAGIWMIGWGTGGNWSAPQDATVLARTIRHGNYDYFTNTTVWDPTITRQDLPASLYLTGKPTFFGSNPWPWVTPENSSAPVATLPARARFDALH